MKFRGKISVEWTNPWMSFTVKCTVRCDISILKFLRKKTGAYWVVAN